MTKGPPVGFRLFAGMLTPAEQAALVAEVMDATAASPLYRPVTPGGKPMSVEMINLGPAGWITDAQGYRYQATHPVTGEAWPPIPLLLQDLWATLADAEVPADACLVNLYRDGARMGLHQDKDEADFRFPVLSVSLGDTALFRIGGVRRTDPTVSLRLASGDVCLLGGEARLAFHGVDRIIGGSSRLIPGGGRINLTLRRAR
jgi:alkylated DNA repair protein (DNA oxidative demethylase)